MKVEEAGNVSVIGAGLMGHGIALQFAAAGFEVALHDTTGEQLEKALADIRAALDTLRHQGIVDETAAAAAPGRISTTTSLPEATAEAALVVEAVYEDLPLKQQVFADLDRHCPPQAVLASNTSSFMTSQLAPSTRRPDRVVVANWWNPAYLVPLVEVVRGPETSDETIAVLCGLLEAAGKRPIVLQKESLGFIGNRMQFALLREALAIVDQGIATPEDVDAVVRTSFGRRLAVAGPLEVFDFAGWDTISHIIDELFPDLDTSPENFPVLKEMVARGEYGVKSGKGFYEWDEEKVAALRRRLAHALSSIDRFPE